jgi:hypothetical protein
MADQNEPQLLVVGGGPRRGRPRAEEPGSTLSIWLPASDHDYYAKLAAKRGESISSTVRLLLQTKFKNSAEPQK